MKERPIIMSAPMVRAILSDRKTQTRRVIKPQPERCERTGFVYTDKRGTRWATGLGFDENATRKNFAYRCPYGRPGDRMWVREAWMDLRGVDGAIADCMFRATFGNAPHGGKWRSPIHMPRWASRITLEVTGVRVERLQDISTKDCWAEGISPSPDVDPVHEYRDLWESINGPGSWDANPWVWAIEFARVDAQQAAA